MSQYNEEENDSGSGIPQGTKNYITPWGFEKLKAELKKLLHTDRPEMVKTVSWAASNGDRSENADYIYGKRKLREIDRRIRFLTKRIESAEVVDPERQKTEKVLFGATVAVLNDAGEESLYRIVGIDESEPSKKHVSWISPIARALLNSKVGDVVRFVNQKGEVELKVVAIRYERWV